MKIIYEVFLKTKVFASFPIIKWMSKKRLSIETYIVFKTILKQQYIHLVYICYVMSVDDIKFILAV